MRHYRGVTSFEHSTRDHHPTADIIIIIITIIIVIILPLTSSLDLFEPAARVDIHLLDRKLRPHDAREGGLNPAACLADLRVWCVVGLAVGEDQIDVAVDVGRSGDNKHAHTDGTTCSDGTGSGQARYTL